MRPVGIGEERYFFKAGFELFVLANDESKLCERLLKCGQRFLTLYTRRPVPLLEGVRPPPAARIIRGSGDAVVDLGRGTGDLVRGTAQPRENALEVYHR